MSFFTPIPSFTSLALKSVIVTALLLPSFGDAALTWTSRQADLSTTNQDREVVASFPFRNEGTLPVTITQIHTDCGCVTTELSRKTYAAGEEGVLKASFMFGARVGPHEKHIYVTEDAAEKPVELSFRLNIKKMVEVSSEMLVWKTSEPLAEKSVTIEIGTPHKITSLAILEVTPKEAVNARLETVEDGAKYRIVLAPTSLRRGLGATVSCVAKFENKKFERFPIVAVVK